MEGERSCYRGGKFMEGEWSCFRGGHFNGGRMVMLQKWSLYWRENGHVTDVVSFMEGDGHFTEVLTLTYVYFIAFYGQSVVFYFLYTVYLTFKSPHLPLPLHQCFPPHCKTFAYSGAGGLLFMPAKIEQVCQSREGE